MPCGRRALKFIQIDIPVLAPDKSIKKQNHIVEVWGIFFSFFLFFRGLPTVAVRIWKGLSLLNMLGSRKKTDAPEPKTSLGTVQRSKSCWSHEEFLSSICFPGAALLRRAVPCLTSLFFWALLQCLTNISPQDKFISVVTPCRPEEFQGLVYVYHT